MEQHERSVTAVVKEKTKTPTGVKVTFGPIEGLGRYPVIITRVPEADAQAMEVSQPYRVLLIRGNARKDIPVADWDYYWNWGGLVAASPLPPTPPQPLPVPPPPAWEAPSPPLDPTRRSIERQVALKAAIERLNALTAAKEPIPVELAELAWKLLVDLSDLVMSAPRPPSAGPVQRDALCWTDALFWREIQALGLTLHDGYADVARVSKILGGPLTTWLKTGTYGSALERIQSSLIPAPVLAGAGYTKENRDA